MTRYYAIADTTHKHSGYQVFQWNVLSDNLTNSKTIWKNITKSVKDVDYHDNRITSKETPILNFVRANMESWAQDPNMYDNNRMMIRSLRADFATHNPGYHKEKWDKLLKDYDRMVDKHHGGA